MVSDNVLKLIPSSPTYVPSEDAIDKALAIIKESLKFTDNIRV